MGSNGPCSAPATGGWRFSRATFHNLTTVHKIDKASPLLFQPLVRLPLSEAVVGDLKDSNAIDLERIGLTPCVGI